MVALPLLMYQRSGSALDTSLLAATEAVPYVAFGLIAGVISDRVRRRPFLVWFDLASASAIVVGIVPAAATAGLLSVPLIFAVALLAGTCFVSTTPRSSGPCPPS
jgi:MFS family permease